MALALQRALDQTPGAQPEVVSDNGPEFVNRDFVAVLKAEGLKRIRTRVHHLPSNGTVEHYHRTFQEEGWAGEQPADYAEAVTLIRPWVQAYCHTRFHSALAYLTPAE